MYGEGPPVVDDSPHVSCCICLDEFEPEFAEAETPAEAGWKPILIRGESHQVCAACVEAGLL